MDIEELVVQLETQYGCSTDRPFSDPMDELISCILSQHTSDANSFPAFDRLKAKFSDWNAMAVAPTEEVIEPILAAGLANQKARFIQACLQRIFELRGEYDVGFLAEMGVVEARAWLEALPGVGPKTAAIVLCFSFGMPIVPVDTHVFRVSKRLGLIGPKTDANKAHDELLGVVPGELAFRFHMALIHHGRAVCKAPHPKCSECALRKSCPKAGL